MLRFLTDDQPVTFTDRWCGPFTQNVERECGDFVVKRADGLWAYQLAVVADDIDQGVTDIVRGADLLDNTPRQIMLTKALGGAPARYMHVPLVLNDRGEKLSKQQGAVPLTDDLMDELEPSRISGSPGSGRTRRRRSSKPPCPFGRSASGTEGVERRLKVDQPE